MLLLRTLLWFPVLIVLGLVFHTLGVLKLPVSAWRRSYQMQVRLQEYRDANKTHY